MRPFSVNGEVWRVARVAPGDPRLIDRTGIGKLATTDPESKTIHVSSSVRPPLLDRVMLHEAAHAITMSHGLLDSLHAVIPERYWVDAEEWACQLVEVFGMEAVAAASEALGRPVCVRGYCHD